MEVIKRLFKDWQRLLLSGVSYSRLTCGPRESSFRISQSHPHISDSVNSVSLRLPLSADNLVYNNRWGQMKTAEKGLSVMLGVDERSKGEEE